MGLPRLDHVLWHFRSAESGVAVGDREDTSLQALCRQYLFFPLPLFSFFFPLLVSYWTVLFKRPQSMEDIAVPAWPFYRIPFDVLTDTPLQPGRTHVLLRNKALLFFSGTFARQMLFFLPIAVTSFLKLCSMNAHSCSFILLHCFFSPSGSLSSVTTSFPSPSF